MNPGKLEQAKNEWLVTVWSPTNVDTASSACNPILLGDESRGPEKSIVQLCLKGTHLEGLLQTQNLASSMGELVTIVYKKIFDPPAALFANGAEGFDFSAQLGVSAYSQQGDAVSYISETFIVVNRSNAKSFWLTVSLFDPRLDPKNPRSDQRRLKGTDFVFCSPTKGTSMPIVAAIAGEQTGFINSSHDSLSAQFRAFQIGNFLFSLGRTEFAKIINVLNKNSDWCGGIGAYPQTDLSQYELEQASIMIESYNGKSKSNQPNVDEFSRVKFYVGQPDLAIIGDPHKQKK